MKSINIEIEKAIARSMILKLLDQNFISEPNSTELFINPKETYDGAIPSGNSVMAYNLVRLYQITEKGEYNELLENQIAFMSVNASDYPAGNGMFLITMLMNKNPMPHITIVLKERSDLAQIREHLPFMANIYVVTESVKYPLLNNQTTFYVCRNHNCLPPTNAITLLC